MKTGDYTRKMLAKKGWDVINFEYQRPKSGFKCIEGGYLCEIEANEEDWEILEAITFDKSLFGNISFDGRIMALYKEDFIALVNKVPNRKQSLTPLGTQIK